MESLNLVLLSSPTSSFRGEKGGSKQVPGWFLGGSWGEHSTVIFLSPSFLSSLYFLSFSAFALWSYFLSLYNTLNGRSVSNIVDSKTGYCSCI